MSELQKEATRRNKNKTNSGVIVSVLVYLSSVSVIAYCIVGYLAQ
ncbi:MAG: hypothetical protein R8M45_04430 [Ghiorsea sp.]